MEISWIAAGVLLGILALVTIIAYWIAGARKKDIKVIGHLIVDAKDQEEGGGVYLQIEVDPKTLKDKAIVQLEVFRVPD